MRGWQSEVRIGLIAGVCAGAIVLVASGIANRARSGAPEPAVSSASWTPPLVDPIQAASAAMARGDSAFLAVAVGDSLQFPGLTSAVSGVATNVRMYSRSSTGLKGWRWEEFVTRVMPYAAAYNAVVQVARIGARARA